jgi:hypothetical protein
MGVDVTCAKCGSDLHACANCIHFDTSATHACRKPVPVPVGNKTKRNTCEVFAPRTVQEFAPEPASPKAHDPRAAFDALFKK